MVLSAFLCVLTPRKVIITANVHELSDMLLLSWHVPDAEKMTLTLLHYIVAVAFSL